MASEVQVPKLLRVAEVEERTGVQRWRLYEMLKRGQGPAYIKIGKTIRISETALVAWIKEQESKPKEEQ